MENIVNLHYVANAFIFSIIGIFILVVSFYIIEKATPQNIYKEIVDNKNTALGIVAGAFIIAISIIIGCAIRG